MRRREFITVFSGVMAWPLSVRAQQQTSPVVGYLSGRSPAEAASVLAAFRQGLGETGYFEGKNVSIEYRWAEGRYDQLPSLAAELLSRRVTVIAATGGEPSALAAKAATATVPVVFTIGSDPIQLGLVASLNKPGANVTGVTFVYTQLAAKRLELLRQFMPKALVVTVLINPTFPPALAEVDEVQTAGRSFGLQIDVLKAGTEQEIDTAFTSMARQKVDALLLGTDPFLLGQRDQIVRLAMRDSIPTMSTSREFVEAGGLMSYGPSLSNGYRQAGIYVGRILGGANPAELPVLQPTSFPLSINLKTAKTLGVTAQRARTCGRLDRMRARCPLLAQSGLSNSRNECPLSGE
jgi:putative tryptophan/tyrosine transport system substrate-binding protein